LVDDELTRTDTDILQIVTELVRAWNDHDVDGVQRCYAPDCEEVDVALAEPQRGSHTIRKLMKYYLRAFPDVHVTVDQVICSDSQAALLWTWHGTHRGRFMNIPPTGRRVSVRGTTMMTICNGRIQRVERVWDVAGLLRGIGLLPEL
jgi:steroid delta-isomerase-like uncharacterized protein